jgi:hypothetical protein
MRTDTKKGVERRLFRIQKHPSLLTYLKSSITLNECYLVVSGTFAILADTPRVMVDDLSDAITGCVHRLSKEATLVDMPNGKTGSVECKVISNIATATIQVMVEFTSPAILNEEVLASYHVVVDAENRVITAAFAKSVHSGRSYLDGIDPTKNVLAPRTH